MHKPRLQPPPSSASPTHVDTRQAHKTSPPHRVIPLQYWEAGRVYTWKPCAYTSTRVRVSTQSRGSGEGYGAHTTEGKGVLVRSTEPPYMVTSHMPGEEHSRQLPLSTCGYNPTCLHAPQPNMHGYSIGDGYMQANNPTTYPSPMKEEPLTRRTPQPQEPTHPRIPSPSQCPP